MKNLDKLMKNIENLEELAKTVAPAAKLETIDLKSKIYPFLNDTAQKLINTEIKTSTFKDRYITTEILCATKRVPINSKGTVSMVYIKKWAKLLNFLAETMVWQHGVLCGLVAVKLAKPKRSNLS